MNPYRNEQLAEEYDEQMRDILTNPNIDLKWTAIALLYGAPTEIDANRFENLQEHERFRAAFMTVYPKYASTVRMVTLADIYAAYRRWYWQQRGK